MASANYYGHLPILAPGLTSTRSPSWRAVSGIIVHPIFAARIADNANSVAGKQLGEFGEGALRLIDRARGSQPERKAIRHRETQWYRTPVLSIGIREKRVTHNQIRSSAYGPE